MDITPLIKPGSNLITAYGNGGFTINSSRVEGSVFLLPNLFIPLNISNVTDMAEASLALLDAHSASIETLLIGSGTQHATTPAILASYLREKRIGYDSMTTGAACRTYNVLLTEDRKIAALLLAVD